MGIQPGLLGKYDLQEQLGRGGMTEVYWLHMLSCAGLYWLLGTSVQ